MQKILKALSVFVLLALLAACAPPAATPAPATTPSSTTAAVVPAATTTSKDARPNIATLRLAGGTDWGYPSPFLFSRGPGYIHSLYIFDTLVWKDAKGNYIPWLAESWTSAPDGLTWTFKLNPKAKWHDGRAVTADDVVFSVEYQTKNAPSFPLRAATELASVTKKGELEVEFKLKQTYAPFLNSLAGAMHIIPKHIWGSVTDPKKFRDEKALIGSGPYILKQYNQADGSYLYEANKNFYLGEPAVKRLEFLPVKDEVLALQQGQIDAGGADVTVAGVADALKQFKQAPWSILEAPGEWTMALKMNMTKAPFNDLRFRRALAYAINMQDLVDRVLLGQGVPGSQGWATPANFWFNPNITVYKQDVAKAKALLDEMNLKDTNGDGVRELDGKPLQYDLIFAAPFDTPRTAELIQQYLKEVGISVKVVGIDRNQRDDRATKGEYDLLLVGYGGLGSDPDSLRTTYSSSQPRTSFTQPIGWKNAEFDKLADEQYRLSDAAARRKVTDQLQKILSDDLPQIQLYHPTRFWIYKKSLLDGWHYTPGGLASGVPQTFDKNLFVLGKEQANTP